MSFGFGIGDFIAVGNLAWSVYRSCKGLTEEFQEVSREALTAHTVVKELQDEAGNDHSVLNVRGAPRRKELMMMISNLDHVLKQLDAIVEKFQHLGRREKRIWNQLKLSNEDLDKVRGKLTFHVNAINTFMASLSRSTLARIETVLIELANEVREGRRPPSIVSVDDAQDQSVWRELESELAEDGISRTDVAQHKSAIKVFLLSLFNDTATETMSLDEVASFVESSNDKEDWETLSRRIPGLKLSSGGPSRVPTMSSVDKASLVSDDSEQYHSAREELSEENLPVPRVSFAAFTKFPNPSKAQPQVIYGIDKRLQSLPQYDTSSRSIYSYRHSLDASIVGESEKRQDALGIADPPKPSDMVLIIDPFHTSVSKLAHAYMRSLVKTSSVVREHIDTVRSTGWKMHESEGADTVVIDTLMKEVLADKNVIIPKWGTYQMFADFRFQDVLEFDHIIYFNSPGFRQYLEDNIQKIAKVKSVDGMENKKPARLTRYDLPSSLQVPELMSSRGSAVPEMFQNRQKLALEEIFRVVQRSTLDFLKREYGLRKISQGFEKATSRRPSRSDSLPPLDRRGNSISSG